MKTCVTLGLNGVNPVSYGGWTGDLVACDSDATGYAAAFATLGYSSSAIFDSGVTLSAFRSVLTTAAANTQPGDWFVLTYSGHGGQSENWGFGGYKETLCPMTASWPIPSFTTCSRRSRPEPMSS